MALTPNDVLNKQFATTRLKEGYDQDEVDDFLDEVLAEFQRLIAENENLKVQLAAAPAAAPGAAADPAEVQALRQELDAAKQQVAQLQTQLEQAQEHGGALDGMNSAEYLQLARRVHEEHVREGVAKRDQLIAEGEEQARTLTAEAQSKADAVLVAAQNRASSLVNEAQATANALASEAESKASGLVREAQQRYDSEVAVLSQQVSSLSDSKSRLERSVSELQEFERNYRASLRSHLEAQLGELERTGGEQPAAAVDPEQTGPAQTGPADWAVAAETTGGATTTGDGAPQAPEPPVPGLGNDTGEQPPAPYVGY